MTGRAPPGAGEPIRSSGPGGGRASSEPAASGEGATWRTLWTDVAEAVGDRVEARWICETASASFGGEFLSALDDPANELMLRHLGSMVERRRSGEPLQYVLGHWGFRRLDLTVDRRVLIPRPESELVAETAIVLARRVTPSRRIVDLGTGSGAIGLSLARELPVVGTEVWLTDVDADALDVARANLAGIGRHAGNVRIAAGSWFEALPPGLTFDVVVSNPPYVAEGSTHLDESVARWEPSRALLAGPDGLDAIRQIVAGAGRRLVPGGALVIEIGSDHETAVRDLLVDHGFADVEVRRDLAGHPRVASAFRPGDSP